MVNKVTAIICHHKGKLIEDCIKALRHHGIHIIVASSVRRTYPRTSWLHFQCNEPTFKRNYASYYAKTKYIAFLDDDVYVNKDCLNKMASYLDNHSKVGMVYAMLYRTDNKLIDTAGSWLTPTGFLYESYEKPLRPIRILAAKSACCMIRRKLFNKVGKFDEDCVIYGEETDLSWRLWHLGYEVRLLPEATGWHETGKKKTPSFYNKRFIHYHGCKNYITMLIKNLNPSRLYIVPINVAIWFMVAIAFLFKNKQASRWILQGIWYNISHLPHILRKRRAIKKTKPERCLLVNPGLGYYWRRVSEYLTHQLHRGG